MAKIATRTDLEKLRESPVSQTIESVLSWLTRLDAGEDIGEEQLGKLKEATRKVLETNGWKEGTDILDKKQRGGILAFLGGLAENEESQEEVKTEEKEMTKMGSKALTSKELAALVAEYETAIREGESKEMMMERFREVTGFNIDGFISHEEELYRKSLEAMEAQGVSTEKLKGVARAVTAEEFVLTNEIEETGVKNAPVLMEKAVKEAMEIVTGGEIDIEKMKRKVDRRLRKVSAVERAKIIEGIIETTVTSRVKIETGRVAKDMTDRLIEAGVGVDKTELEKLVEAKIIYCWRNNEPLSYGQLAEEVVKISKTGVPERVDVIIRETELEMEITRKANESIFEVERGRVLREKTVMAVMTTEGNEGVNRKQAVSYARFIVNGFYRDNPATGLRDEMRATVSEEGFRKGRTVDEVFRETKALWGLLQQGGIKKKIAMFKRFSETLKLSGADEIGACRAVNGIMKIMSKNPRMVKTLEMARKVIRIEESMGNWQGKALMWIGRRIGSEGIQKIGSEMVGGVVMREVVRNSMIIIGKQGLTQGISMIGSGLIKGGTVKLAEVAASMALKKGAEGLIAKGATWLIGALGGVAGPPGWVVAAVVWVGSKLLGAIKKGITKVREGLEKAGIYIPVATQMRKLYSWAGRQLKKLPVVGKLLGDVADFLAEFSYLLWMGIMATITVAVAPIIVGVFGGLFLYSILQSSMISSLVGPVNMGAGVGVEVEEDLPDLLAEEVTCKNGGGSTDEVRKKVMEGIKQNQGSWEKMELPKGCTFSDMGCGPTAVAGVLMKKDINLTPDVLVDEIDSPYKEMGCDGSSLKQAKESLEKHLDEDEKVKYDEVTRKCDKEDIANWICDGNVVMVLASFYKNKKRETVNHLFLAVEVKDGEIETVDPFYDDGTKLDGTKEYGYVQAIRECMVISIN